MLGFARVEPRGGRIRTVVILPALCALAACAADKLVLSPPPAAAAEQARNILRAQLEELMK